MIILGVRNFRVFEILEHLLYCYFSKFWDIPQFFVIILKFYHKVIIPSKDADRNANSFNPDQAVSL